MTKKEMAIQIASALFGKKVDENNWKVIDLQKRKKDDLEDLLNLAEKAVESTLTVLEQEVYNFIKNNTDPDSMECVDIDDLANGLCKDAKVLRGVISSLVKKDMIEVEEYDANFDTNYFYWLKGAFA